MGGGDKSLLPFRGSTLLAHVVARLRPQADPLLLNANGDPARFAAYGLPVLPDPVPGHPGPLAGVLAGLDWAAAHGHARILTVPGDTPFVPADLLARLAERDAPVCCAASGSRQHPAVALWSTMLAPALRVALAAGRFRVGAFAASHGLAAVAWADAPDDPFLNINTAGELAAAANA